MILSGPYDNTNLDGEHCVRCGTLLDHQGALCADCQLGDRP